MAGGAPDPMPPPPPGSALGSVMDFDNMSDWGIFHHFHTMSVQNNAPHHESQMVVSTSRT